MIVVLDASALMAFLLDETGSQVIEQALNDPATECVAHAVNVYEVYRHFLRAGGEIHARRAVADLRNYGVTVRQDMDDAFWMDAAVIRNRVPMSMADAYGIALSNRLGADFLTSDHHELESAAGFYRIRFFR